MLDASRRVQRRQHDSQWWGDSEQDGSGGAGNCTDEDPAQKAILFSWGGHAKKSRDESRLSGLDSPRHTSAEGTLLSPKREMVPSDPISSLVHHRHARY